MREKRCCQLRVGNPEVSRGQLVMNLECRPLINGEREPNKLRCSFLRARQLWADDLL
jgi:hypothetical protein